MSALPANRTPILRLFDSEPSEYTECDIVLLWVTIPWIVLYKYKLLRHLLGITKLDKENNQCIRE